MLAYEEVDSEKNDGDSARALRNVEGEASHEQADAHHGVG